MVVAEVDLDLSPDPEGPTGAEGVPPVGGPNDSLWPTSTPAGRRPPKNEMHILKVLSIGLGSHRLQETRGGAVRTQFPAPKVEFRSGNPTCDVIPVSRLDV